MKLIAVLTTTASREEAERIATSLVERSLAACVQISAIESVYTWEGTTQRDDEYRVLIKTTADRYLEVEATILEMHSYDLPAIYAFGIEHVYEPFGAWVAEQSRKAAG
jgi:periplasmic divalent cation tolerance protein